MQPSSYQQNIFRTFDNLEDGGTLQINAVAGAGKTTTLMMLLKQQKQHLLDRSLICAFNKSIATELVETPGEPVPSFWKQPQQAELLEAR